MITIISRSNRYRVGLLLSGLKLTNLALIDTQQLIEWSKLATRVLATHYRSIGKSRGGNFTKINLAVLRSNLVF